MNDLIKALQIFAKYTDANYPTSCEHDILYVQVSSEEVTEEDKIELEKLGFQVDTDLGNFSSYRFGCC